MNHVHKCEMESEISKHLLVLTRGPQKAISTERERINPQRMIHEA